MEEDMFVDYATADPGPLERRPTCPPIETEVAPVGNLMLKQEAAKYLRVSERTLDRYVKAGRLKRFKNKYNGRIYFDSNDLLQALGSKLDQTKLVLGYCRAAVLGSTTGVAGSASDRLREQADRLVKYSTAAGIRIDKLIFDIAPGHSAKNRPGLDELMELVMRKQVSAIVVESVDRIARWGMGDVFQMFLAWHKVDLHVTSPTWQIEEYRAEAKEDLVGILHETKILMGESS